MEENPVKDAYICLPKTDIDFIDSLIEHKKIINRSKFIQLLVEDHRQKKKLNCFLQFIKDSSLMFIAFMTVYSFFLFNGGLMFFIITIVFGVVLILVFTISYIKNMKEVEVWR